MPTLTILVGLPGSGKSTWRAEHTAAVIISSDDLIDEFAAANGLTYSEAFKKVDMKQIQRDIMSRFQTALVEGRDIIVDRTNMPRKSRALFLNGVPDTYHRRAVVFRVPEEELKRRLRERASATGKFIPEHVVLGMQSSYQEPTLDEGFQEVVFISQ